MPTQIPKNGRPDSTNSRAIASTPERRNECMVRSNEPSPGSTALSAAATSAASLVTNAPGAPILWNAFSTLRKLPMP